MTTSNAFFKHLLALGMIFALPAANTWAGSKSVVDCGDLLSLEAVKARFAGLIETATAAPDTLAAKGIQNSEVVAAITKVSLLTGDSVETVGQKILDVVAIKSPEGIPNGDEFQIDAVVTFAFLSSLTGHDVHDIVQQALEFMPLLENMTLDTNSANALLKVSALYEITPEQAMAKFEEFQAGSNALKEKIQTFHEAQLAKADGLTRAMLQAVVGGAVAVPNELVVAALESAIVSKKPVADAIRTVEQILDHDRAVLYTTHEQAAMLKASMILGQSLDESLAKLKTLDEGAKERFGSGLTEEFERPAVNLILLGGQDPVAILNMLEYVAKEGSGYTKDAAAVVMAKALVEVSKGHPNQKLLESSMIAP